MSTRTLVTVFAVSLLALAGCSREKSDWRSAQAADTSESYQQFIAAHPDSTLIATARERLNQLAEEKDWRSAAAADTLDAYQQFIASYPSGKWAKEAQVRIENFAGNAPPSGASAATSAAPSAAGAGAAISDSMPANVESGTAGSAFGVQLGAFSSPEAANQEWKKLQGDAGGMLDGLSPRVVVGESSGKKLYRLQSTVRDEAQARAVCGGLKASKKACVVVPPHLSAP